MEVASITKEYLQSIADRLAETVTDPRFLERVQAIHEAGDFEAQYARARTINAASLEAEGVDLPPGFRVAPRTFEKPEYAKRNGVQSPGQEPGSTHGQADPMSYDRSSWVDGALRGQPAAMPEPAEIARQIRAGAAHIAEFVTDAPFLALLNELAAVPPPDRPRFVLDVVLEAAEREKRGIEVPDNMLIQRSTFHDGRPTLFCVSALTPLAYPWRKVTFTFDNDMLDSEAAE